MSVNSIVEYFNDSSSFLTEHPVVFALLMAWTLAWKGFALWKAGRLSHKIWFIVILVANTFGILEIVYLLFVAKKYSVTTEVGSEK